MYTLYMYMLGDHDECTYMYVYHTRSNYSNVLIIPNNNFNYLFRSNSVEQHDLLIINTV